MSAVTGVILAGNPHISTSSQPQQPRPQAPGERVCVGGGHVTVSYLTILCIGSGHSQHSRSSSTSSASSAALSQDSSHQPHPQTHTMTVVTHSLTNSGPGHHPSSSTTGAATAYETSTAAPAMCGGSSGSTPSAQAHSQGMHRTARRGGGGMQQTPLIVTRVTNDISMKKTPAHVLQSCMFQPLRRNSLFLGRGVVLYF